MVISALVLQLFAKFKLVVMGPGVRRDDWAYFTAEKRLSKEFAGTIGWAPATMASFAGAGAAAGAAGVSESDGFSGGRAAAWLVSAAFGAAAFGAAAFGAEASGR